MTAKPIVFAAFLFPVLAANAQPANIAHGLPKFMGREISVTEPARDATGMFPKGPASVCIQGPPQRQCYTAPEDFGNSPTVTVVQLKKGMPALLFSAASGGVAGWGVQFAILRPGTGKFLDEFLLLDKPLSNQNQHAFWNDPTISDVQIFATADYVWGPNEGRFGEHRYIVSAYVCVPPLFPEGQCYYYLDDRYMTVREYDLQAGADVLAAEKPEILARLRRAKAAAERPEQAPR